jgi:hypothetical protein
MKSKKSKKSEKTKLDLFRERDFKLKSIEMAAVVLICAGVIGISFFGSGKNLNDYNQKEKKSVSSSQPEIRIVNSAVAAGNQNNENIASTGDDLLPKENREIEVTPEEIDLAKEQADKFAAAKKIIARQHAAEIALINNAPVLAGQTNKLPNGLRVCPVKSENPQRGGQTHVDEDCCADYNEYPNPRCYYPPDEMAILKKR